MKVCLAVLLVTVAVSAGPQSYGYEPPRQTYLAPEPSNRVDQVVQEGMPYDFQWGVQDLDNGNAFSHVENSDGRTTQGEYRVLMPDGRTQVSTCVLMPFGRTQVVKFFDNGEGYNADVTYEN
ncbi:pro-resilin-like [Procambarus clarkii]|uniref:pro-resilin-like n=1 Tax=Procambarus clarkii TaxID=6728 RepID=UPI003742F7FC